MVRRDVNDKQNAVYTHLFMNLFLLQVDGLESQFESIVKRDPLAEISEQEKELLWRFR